MEHNFEKYFNTNSIYWKKLQALYEANEFREKKKTKYFELHHKFLRCFSKLEGTPIDNDENNLVLLLPGDHFLAHYYLWKCTNKGFRQYTARPVVFMYKKGLSSLGDTAAEEIAKSWNTDFNILKKNKFISEYNKSRKGTPHSEEHTKKVVESLKKYWVPIINLETGEIYENRKSCPYIFLGEKYFLPEDYTGNDLPEAVKYRNKCVKKCIYDIVERSFDIKEMTVDEIYKLCVFTTIALSDIKNTKTLRLFDLITYCYKNNIDIDTITKIVKKPSSEKKLHAAAETGKIMSKRLLGKYWWNNGKQNIRSKECPGEGWVRGMIK